MQDLYFRQVHLDFHTSEHIPDVGADFDPDEFVSVLEDAQVNSITCFSRCHHGWLYHDSDEFPERRHPNLARNLLREQIEACHARGIRVPIYITVGWDHFTAREHPEWLVEDDSGSIIGTKPFEAGFYRFLCLNSPYVDFLQAQTEEVCRLFAVDGVFFDIVWAHSCCCKWCIEGMLSKGIDPSDPVKRNLYAEDVLVRFQQRMSRVVRGHHPDATVFFNSGHVSPRHRRMVSSFTHLELESLPSGGWGYMHFPLAQRYARTLGVPTMGMTGKFHTTWGDFQSFKNQAALDYECFSMLALGAKCSIGDQLHPRGKIDRATYSLIGNTYARVAASEPWCAGSVPLAEIGVLTPEEFQGGFGRDLSPALIGATRMLTESRHQFDIIDSSDDFGRYPVLLLPDHIPVDDRLSEKLSRFVEAGGAVMASFRSGLRPSGDEFSFDALGIALKGEAEFSPDFILPERLGDGLPDAPHVMYARALHVEPRAGSEILARVARPYFNRTWEHFCSHGHAPPMEEAGYPAAVGSSRCTYLAHPIFTLYHDRAPLWCKKIAMNALKRLLPKPLIEAEGPSTIVFALLRQESQNRLVLHALHYIPERRAHEFDVIEDVIPVMNVPVAVRVDQAVDYVTMVPSGERLEFECREDSAAFRIPKIDGHQMVSIQLL